MAFLKSSQITGLSAKDVDVRGFTQADSINLGDRAYTEHEVLLADAYSITGDVTISDNLILSKLSDDGEAITLTGNATTTRTISGSGSLEGSTFAQTPNASLTSMTGVIGSAVTGSPALNLSNTSGQIDNVQFPSGTVLQHKAMEITGTIANASNTTDNYVQSGGSYSTTFNGALTPLTLTTKRSNSWILLRGSMHVYYTSAVVSGQFTHSRMYLMYGTAGTGASTGNYTEYYAVNNYQDCRSTNNVSGQEMDLVTGMVRAQLSGVVAGTPAYFGMRVNRKNSGSELGGYLEVMEIAE